MSKDSKLTRTKLQLAKQPNLTADLIMKHLGVNKTYAYNLLSTARKSLGMRKQPDGKWKLKERMQSTPSPAVAMLAEQVVQVETLIDKHYGAKQTALDVQVGGAHYKNMKIQPVEFITANNLGFLEGSIVKRICRWKDKGGIEDLNKIKHEVDLLIELNNLK